MSKREKEIEEGDEEVGSVDEMWPGSKLIGSSGSQDRSSQEFDTTRMTVLIIWIVVWKRKGVREVKKKGRTRQDARESTHKVPIASINSGTVEVRSKCRI